MLTSVQQLTYVIVLCDDLARMKALLPESLCLSGRLRIGDQFGLPCWFGVACAVERTRSYNGRGIRTELPGVQLAFLVSPAEKGTENLW